ncbi:MAG: hypothetical protein CENE_01498 [Candidatus Celerinatantimonas neptuna]|nr:MAG: hypothetical protein CENE_01498 [Candidatus Celerinatantimonas neptuna]
MNIRIMTKDDFYVFWPTFLQIVRAQETYAFDPEISFDEAYTLWCELPLHTFVCLDEGVISGSYYIKANGVGPSSHICNCGYMVCAGSRGKGIARLMCEHSQQIAKESGYTAMQFNSVVSSNVVAVHLWKQLGYQIIGTVPDGYNHLQQGYVDTYIMYKQL